MRRTLLLGAGAALALSSLLPGAALAADCNGTVTQIDAPDGSTFYVDDRDITTGGIWVYQESNGEAGLQSGGTNAIGDVDSCAGEGTADTLIL